MTEPHVIAIIPARGGSKRIPGKNLAPIAGEPLIAHTIHHALNSGRVSTVYVSTDDDAIAGVAESCGAEAIRRPKEIAGDAATSESALLHVLDDRVKCGLDDPDIVVFLQCTSPVRRPGDIDRAIDQILHEGADSLFSACPNDRLLWEETPDGPASINYDFHDRKRDQDLPPQYRENGSIYIFKPMILRKHNNRLGGRIAIYEMDYWTSFQIDLPEHVRLIEWILQQPEYRTTGGWPESIDLIVCDFDGVLTDNTVVTSEDGRESVVCNRGDGLGLTVLRNAGVPVIVMSMEENTVVAARCKKLRLPCQQGVTDKAKALSDYLSVNGFESKRTIYVGNDVNDLEAMRLVGYAVAVADAHPAVLRSAKFILSTPGGKGAIRELCTHLSRSLTVLRDLDVVL